jgi:uncharacterized protein (TIGR03089 family)
VPDAVAAGEVFALSLAPLGRGFADGPPPGARDYSVDVLAMGDRWSGRPVPDAVPALEAGGSTVTAGDLVEIALRRAAELGVVAGDRVLSTEPWTSPTSWLDGLLVPLAAAATLVLVANPDESGLTAKVEAERATATLGIAVPGVRPL